MAARSPALRLAVLVALAFFVSLTLSSTGRAFAQGPNVTTTTVSSNPPSASPGSKVTISVVVTDEGANPSPPTGNITLSDQGAGGSFSTICLLSPDSGKQAACSVSYTVPSSAGPPGVTITAAYPGDASHLGGGGSVIISVLYPVKVTLSPGSVEVVSGSSINFTVTVASPTAGASTPAPAGQVWWSDGGAGGNFSSPACDLAAGTGTESTCSVTYKSFGGVNVLALQTTISATYYGSPPYSGGSASAGLTVLPAQVSVLVSFAAYGNPQGFAAPVFTYLLNNQTHSVALGGAPSVYKVDVDSLWFVPNQLRNSSATVAWNLLGSAQGTAAYSLVNSEGVIPLRFVYYYQYFVDLGYTIDGGTAGASVPPFVTFTSYGVTKTTAAPGKIWADAGTQYAYPAQLPGSLGEERWLAENVTGALDGPGDYSVTYFHQYSVEVSYAIVGPSANGTQPPVFYGVSMGVPFNESAASLNYSVWLDSGSRYSFTNPLIGSNATIRWDAGAASSGAVGGPTIVARYHEQFPVTATATIVGAPPSTQLVKGAQETVTPVISGFSGGLNTSAPLNGTATAVWLDSGTSYSISGVLLSLPTERWVAMGTVGGSVSPGESVNQTYYEQYLVRVGYSGTASVLSLNYTSLGEPSTGAFTPQGSTVWVDAGTSLVVPDSTAGERWSSSGGPTVSATSANMTVDFIQQFEVQASLEVLDGGLPLPTELSGTSGGQPIQAVLSEQPTGIWLDAGTSYNVPRDLLLLPQERWVAPANLTGTVTGPVTVTQTYYHQDLLNLSFTGASASQPPTVSYTSLGVAAQSGLGPVWADLGSSFSVDTSISTGAGQRLYASPMGGNVTGPVEARAVYFSQDLLNYTLAQVGGSLPSPPLLSGSQAGAPLTMPLRNGTGSAWLDSNTNWQVALRPGDENLGSERWIEGGPTTGTLSSPVSVNFEFYLQYLVETASVPKDGGNVTLGGWFNASAPITLNAAPGKGWTLAGWQGAGSGSYSGGSGTITLSVVAAANETAVFEPRLTIVSSTGGSVAYTTGPSLESVGPGRSVQTFVEAGGNVTLEARASFPYSFVGWSGIETSAPNPVSLSPSSPITIQAQFAPNYYDILGLPAAVFGGSLTTYLARHSIVGLGRSALRSLRMRLRLLRS